MIGLQHGSSRKRLEITLITDGDSSRIRYHSPSPYVLSPTSASRFTIQVKQFNFFITFSLFETKTITMSTPTTPVISVTDINDETTVIEQPREESPSPLPIPPPQSMSSLNNDSMSPHHSPIVSSDDEADNDSDTAFSRSRTPSPDSTVAILMQFLTDTAEQLAEPIRVVNHTMRNVIVTRDRMIHRLSTATEPLTNEQREALIISLQEFAIEAENLGLPLIPQEIIEGFVGLSYIQTLRGYLVMGIPYMVVSLFVHLYMFVTSCAQYKHEAQSLVVHSWSQHLENPAQTHHGLLPFTTATWFMKP